MRFSCVIPCRDKHSKGVSKLIASIRNQDYIQDEIEIICVDEGDSEQAKALGIARAHGEIIAMFCDDNVIKDRKLFHKVETEINNGYDAVYPSHYWHTPKDYCLNRYFALFGGNDPVVWYLGKNDRMPYSELVLRRAADYPPSWGCNGFFYRASAIKDTDLDHYYPMDNAMEVFHKSKRRFLPLHSNAIWHKTSNSNLFKFLKKRYIYARDLYCERTDRRWKAIANKKDMWNLVRFVLATLLIFPHIATAMDGYKRKKDFAWFWHPVVAYGFLITYGLLVCRNLIKRRYLFQVHGQKTLSAA